MRELRFRGMTTTGKWVYGDLRTKTDDGESACEVDGYDVNPDSVGQLTGLKDKNGKEIYEGDVVTSSSGIKAKVIWSDKYALFAMIGSAWKTEHPFIGLDPEKLEIVGNIYESPNLLQP